MNNVDRSVLRSLVQQGGNFHIFTEYLRGELRSHTQTAIGAKDEIVLRRAQGVSLWLTALIDQIDKEKL